jgi:hypothetical protein
LLINLHLITLHLFTQKIKNLKIKKINQHRAYDLALATSYTFAGGFPAFKEVGEIKFKQPVDIGGMYVRTYIHHTHTIYVHPRFILK